jgi:hypothetical protein
MLVFFFQELNFIDQRGREREGTITLCQPTRADQMSRLTKPLYTRSEHVLV